MPRKTPSQRAEAAISAVLAQLARARAEVARLEAVVGKLTGNLIEAQPDKPSKPGPVQDKSQRLASLEAMLAEAARNPMPTVERQRPPPPPEDPGEESIPGAELSPADTLGAGRWM
jgi:hypothetical protein